MNAHEDLDAELATEEGAEQNIQVNFKNTLTTVTRHLEEILYAPSLHINQVMTEMVRSISRYYHKKRKGRHYSRKSKQPTQKWNGKTANV